MKNLPKVHYYDEKNLPDYSDIAKSEKGSLPAGIERFQRQPGEPSAERKTPFGQGDAVLRKLSTDASRIDSFASRFWEKESYDHQGFRVNACDPTNEEEVRRYFSAVHQLKNSQGRKNTNDVSNAVYDEFVAIHLGVVGLSRSASFFGDGYSTENMNGLAQGAQAGRDGGHNGAGFLPWHRQYLKVFEAALQEIDPLVTIPYWDWTDYEGTQRLFAKDMLGQFAESGRFSVDPDLHFAPVNGRQPDLGMVSGGARLRRNFGNGTPSNLEMNHLKSYFNNDALNHLLEEQTYDLYTNADRRGSGYRSELEGKFHNPLHGWVGGSMGLMSSPNDPVFWMHHANVDRLWTGWQLQQRHQWMQANPGKIYNFEAHYYKPQPLGPENGHTANSLMWPWDGGASTPAQYNRQSRFPLDGHHASIGDNGRLSPAEAKNHYDYYFRGSSIPEQYPLPVFNQKITVADVLDPFNIGPKYDGLDYAQGNSLV